VGKTITQTVERSTSSEVRNLNDPGDAALRRLCILLGLAARRLDAEIDEFCQACRAGKAETDDLVERSTVQHITGYYVIVDEMDRFGNVKQMKKWIPGNAHAGMKWLAARRPAVYREQKEVRHHIDADEAFLCFLDQMEAQHDPRMIEHQPSPDYRSCAPMLEVIEAQAVEVDDTKPG
jgi:hypothetical protein